MSTISPSEAVDLAVRIVCLARLITIVELLLIRAELGAGGVLDGNLLGLTNPPRRGRLRLAGHRLIRKIDRRTFFVMLMADLGVGVVLLLWPATTWLIGAAVLFHVIEMKRHYLSVDGADQMMLIVLVATFMSNLVGSPESARATVTFLSAVVCLAYLSAGLYKAASATWQGGLALAVILQTRVLGTPEVARQLHRYPRLSHLAGIVVVVWESTFFLALIAPKPIMIAFLLIGLGFHLSCAFLMGLNTFVWAFMATYPAVIVTNSWIRPRFGNWDMLATVVALGVMTIFLTMIARTYHFDSLRLPAAKPGSQ